MKKKKIFQIILVVILIAVAVNSFFVIRSINEYRKGDNVYNEIRNETVYKDPETDSYGLDFKALKETNPDFVGWLTLADTVIDYPVVKGVDNDYYLHHLFTGEYNQYGTLFVDFRNRDLFEDRLSVIYGHSMLNGSMFFILERYENQSFYESHKEFLFQTEGQNYLLKPFAGKVVDAKEPFLRLDFAGDDDFMQYLNEYIRGSTFKSDVSVNGTDKVVMMIKCSADYEDARYVLLSKVEPIY